MYYECKRGFALISGAFNSRNSVQFCTRKIIIKKQTEYKSSIEHDIIKP